MDTKITPIPGHPGPENIYKLENEATRVTERENNILYKMGRKFGFLVIIIGENCYRVNIGDNTWEFLNTDKPGPYEETVITDGSTTITGTQHSQL